jgi:hypothetical protein
MKAGRFAIGGAQIQQVETNGHEKNVWCPGRDPCRNAGAFAERKKKVNQKVHRKNKKNRSRNTR